MRKFFVFLLIIGIVAAVAVRIRYGGGEPYRDLSTTPVLSGTALEEVLRYPEPIGSVVISDDNRIFFTVHPESRPQGNKLLEWDAGAAVPYPNGALQPQIFDTVSGLTIDRQQRLWTVDHGKQGFSEPRLIAIDLRSGAIVHDRRFEENEAPAGSFLLDVDVTQDGRFVIIADSSVLRKRPALIVYDVATGKARRILESHESVSAENYLIRTAIRDLSYFGGLYTIKGGVATIEIDADNEWLYYAAINHDGLYRIRMQHVLDANLSEEQLAGYVERFCDKPLSDGLSIDPSGNLYVTDVEHNAVFVVGKDRRPRTMIRSDQLRWAAAVTSGSDGYLYVADSAFPELVLRTKEHIQSKGPYSIYRFSPQALLAPGR